MLEKQVSSKKYSGFIPVHWLIQLSRRIYKQNLRGGTDDRLVPLIGVIRGGQALPSILSAPSRKIKIYLLCEQNVTKKIMCQIGAYNTN